MSKAVVLSDSDDKAGLSMIEQLVPEVTHVLSFLDRSSLCRLSMTCPLMRKAANDDYLWKSLYHKDFSAAGNETPVNGWKAHYAATTTIMNLNAEFFNIMTKKSLCRMRRFWLNADSVSCFHGSGEIRTGYKAVMQRWKTLFDGWEYWTHFCAFNVEARVLTNSAWVTMSALHNGAVNGPMRVSNVFELHDNRWLMVHHHCTVVYVEGAMYFP